MGQGRKARPGKDLSRRRQDGVGPGFYRGFAPFPYPETHATFWPRPTLTVRLREAEDFPLTQAPPRKARPRRWLGDGAVFVLVTLAHVAFFAWIGLRTPFSQMRVMDEPRIVEALLIPPPPSVEPRLRPLPSISNQPPSPVAPYRPRLVVPVAPTEVAPIPAPPAPPAAPAVPAGARVSIPQLPPEWNGLKGALRGSNVGCGNRDRVGLNAQERAVCDEKLGLAASKAPVLGLGIEAGKQLRFDQTAAERARTRRAREGSMTQPMVNCTGVGSNFGVGCTPP